MPSFLIPVNLMEEFIQIALDFLLMKLGDDLYKKTEVLIQETDTFFLIDIALKEEDLDPPYNKKVQFVLGLKEYIPLSQYGLQDNWFYILYGGSFFYPDDYKVYGFSIQEMYDELMKFYLRRND